MKAMNFLFTALVCLAVISCGKDDNNTNCTKLKGTWTGESWIEDGEQFFGDTIFISSSVIEFKDLTDGHGDYVWTIGYTIGGSETIIGEYDVNAGCDEVTLTPKGGGPSATYHFRYEGDVLILDGVINNIDTELKFRK
jgi:hypothetical protein